MKLYFYKYDNKIYVCEDDVVSALLAYIPDYHLFDGVVPEGHSTVRIDRSMIGEILNEYDYELLKIDDIRAFVYIPGSDKIIKITPTDSYVYTVDESF